MKYTKLFNLSLLITCNFLPYYGAYAIEFDTSVIDSISGKNIDVSMFENDGSILEGDYLTDIIVNKKKMVKNKLIPFITNNNQIKGCVPPEIIQEIGLLPDVIARTKTWGNNKCVDFNSIDKNVTVHFNDKDQELNISIPQSFFLYSDPNWIAPIQRDNGINGLFLDYDINYSKSSYKNQDNNYSLSTYGTTGLNLGAWRFRGDYQYTRNDNSHEFNWSQRYGFRDIASLSAKLRIGEFYTFSNLFDSVRFIGTSFYSDENMMPDSVRGYAPEVSGTAETNATVTITQNGRILKKIQVPPGPFKIEGLTQYVTGILDVKVEESNGKIMKYTAYANSVPFLTRFKQLRYKINAGKLKPFGKGNVAAKNFVSGEVSYGLTNLISIYGGATTVINNDEYQAYSIGMGQNLGLFGALSVDMTHSISKKLNTNETLSGNSYRINYSKTFDTTGTQINFMGYRFSDKNYTSFSRYSNGVMYQDYDFENNVDREKTLFTLAFSQNIEPIDTIISLSGTRQNFWNGKKNDSLNLSISKRISTGLLKDLTVMLNASQYSDSYYGGDSNGKNNTVSLYFSYPFDSNSSLSASSSYDDRTRQFAPRVDFYSTNDLGTRSYNAGIASYDGVKNPSFSGGINNKQSFGQGTLSGSYSSDYKQLNTGISGSITATRYGIAAHDRVYQNQTRLFLDTEGTSGVIFDEAGNIGSNVFGSAVVSNVGAYRKNEQHINESLTKSDISVDSTVIETALTDGAIGYYNVKIISGSQLLMSISLTDGKKPPFGTIIYDTEQQERGIVSDNGMAYVSGVKKDIILFLKWKDNNCKIMIGSKDYQLDKINEYICR